MTTQARSEIPAHTAPYYEDAVTALRQELRTSLALLHLAEEFNREGCPGSASFWTSVRVFLKRLDA